MTKLNSLDLGSQLLAITQDRGDYMVYIIWIFKDIHNHFCIYLNNKARYIHITAKHKPIPKSPQLCNKVVCWSNMTGEAYYPPTMFISKDTPTTNSLQAIHERSIGIQFLPPCWKLLPLDSSISFTDWVSWWGHTIHKLQGLVFNLCWKIWILIFLVENIQVLALPNTPCNKAKNNSPRWFSLNVVAINFPINIEPLLKIAHPKNSIHHFHS